MFDTKPAKAGVTFCIPTWNHRDFLPRSIKSALDAARVLSASGLLSQVLVIDDASRDGSQRALAGLALMTGSDKLDILLLERNVGLAAVRNIGLAKGVFDYICFLDADNELLPANIDVFVRALRETKAAVTYGNLIRHDGIRSIGLMSNDYINDAFYEDNYVDALSLCDRRKLQRHGGFEESLKCHEDWELYLHLLAEGEDIVFVPVCMGYYYVNAHSMVQTEMGAGITHFHRRYNQRGGGIPAYASRRRMYHPDIGWLGN